MKIENNVWFCSDLHLGHKNILKLCNRPFKDLDDMHNALIKNWNFKVLPEDTVYILGDFSFLNIGLSTSILSKLNGKKILILGNHDQASSRMLRMGFAAVCEEMVIRERGIVFRLNHYPYINKKSWLRKLLYRVLRHKEKDNRKRPVRGNENWLLHGHTHIVKNKLNNNAKSINVAWDMWNYYPVSVNEIIELINKS